jgi:peptide/nickel transport system ATP-binding protein
MTSTSALLTVEGLSTSFFTRDGEVRAVQDLSFAVNAGETLAVVGESGCGKSVTSLSIMRLLPEGVGRIVAGSVSIGGEDLVRVDEARMRSVRGNDISMIFQEPMSSLNPSMRVGRQIAEVILRHQGVGASQAREQAVQMLRTVRVPDPERRANEYPHQLSGGMRQRVMIAIALACRPKLLIADEPTTALDVTVQAQVLNLMRRLQREFGTAIVLITHDLGVVAETADRVVVMYAGRKVEEASVTDLFRTPRHPYTLGLLNSVPRLGSSLADTAPERLVEIPGTVPDLRQLRAGCAFVDRCGFVTDRCRSEAPPLTEPAPGHRVACFETARVSP